METKWKQPNTSVKGTRSVFRVHWGRAWTKRGQLFLKKCYWSIVDLQCCVNFCCTAKWLSYTYVHIYIFFFSKRKQIRYGLSQDTEYSSMFYTVGRCCLIHFVYSLHLLIPSSQSSLSHLPPLWQSQACSLCGLFLFHTWVHLCHVFYSVVLLIWLPQVLAVASRLFSCSMWDLVPWPGIQPRPPALGEWSFSPWTTREVPVSYFRVHM